MFWDTTRKLRREGGWALGAALLVVACGCLPRAERDAPPKTVNDWFAITIDGKTMQLHLAINAAEMERGLMQRHDLPSDRGMLFVYRTPTAMSFWMRDTPLPLDIGFFSPDGELVEVYAMQPFDETPIRSRSSRLQFALEMKQGWFHDHGVKPGARLDLIALRASLQARGAAPEEFSLR